MPSTRTRRLAKFRLIQSCALAGLLIAGSYARAQVCTWSTVSSPNVNTGVISNVLSSVSAVASNDVWAVGYNLLYPNTATYHTLTEHWDGSQWAIIPSPNQDSSQLYGVAAAGTNDVWAVGTSTQGSIAYALLPTLGWSSMDSDLLEYSERDSLCGCGSLAFRRMGGGRSRRKLWFASAFNGALGRSCLDSGHCTAFQREGHSFQPICRFGL